MRKFNPLDFGARPISSPRNNFNPADYGAVLIAKKNDDEGTLTSMGKAALKGLTAIGDIPHLAAKAVQGTANAQMQKDFLRAKSNITPEIDIASKVPTAHDAIEEYTGFDIEPHPTSSGARIGSKAIEFGTSMLPWNLNGKAKLFKPFIEGAGIGGVSGVLQETGVNPLAADIAASVTTPLTARGIKTVSNLLPPFTSNGRAQVINDTVSDILKDKVGKQHLTNVISRLEPKNEIFKNATTAELAQNTGLSSLHRAIAPNVPAIAEKQALTDAEIAKQLKSIAPIDVSPEQIGITVRDKIFNNLQTHKKNRAVQTKPLYKAVEKIKEGIELSYAHHFLDKEIKYAKGDIKDNLLYVKKLLESNETTPKKLLKTSETPEVRTKNNTLLDYALFGKDVQKQVMKAVNAAKNPPPLPVPIEVVNAVKAINSRLEKAKKFNDKESTRVLTLAKENILKDMLNIPEEALARGTYDVMSKPVSAIEKEPLLSKFVKKDEFEKDFTLDPEKIPTLIKAATLKNTRALMTQVKNDPKVMQNIKASFINDLIDKGTTSGMNAQGSHNFSYDKVSKLLKNQEKLKLIFNQDEMKQLRDFQKLLAKRNFVNTAGRAIGSNTQSETTLLNNLSKAGSGILSKFGREALAYTVPGGGMLFDATKDYVKNSKKAATDKLLGQALLDPSLARELLSMVNIKDKNPIYDPAILKALITQHYNNE